MEVPWKNLKSDTLRAIIDEFVSRDGTDYGEKEVEHETKIQQVHQLLVEGKVRLVFDSETESCDLREVAMRDH